MDGRLAPPLILIPPALAHHEKHHNKNPTNKELYRSLQVLASRKKREIEKIVIKLSEIKETKEKEEKEDKEWRYTELKKADQS